MSKCIGQVRSLVFRLADRRTYSISILNAFDAVKDAVLTCEVMDEATYHATGRASATIENLSLWSAIGRRDVFLPGPVPS